MNNINNKVYKHYLRPDLICEGRVAYFISSLANLSGTSNAQYEYAKPNIQGVDWIYFDPPPTKPKIDTGTFL